MARQNTLDAAKAQLGHAAYANSATGHVAGHADGHMFTNHGEEVVEVIATGAVTVVFPTPSGQSGLDVEDPEHVFAGAGRILAGPFPDDLYNNKSGADAGKMYINFTGTATNASVKVYRLP
jgi:hypothetical protein